MPGRDTAAQVTPRHRAFESDLRLAHGKLNALIIFAPLNEILRRRALRPKRPEQQCEQSYNQCRAEHGGEAFLRNCDNYRPDNLLCGVSSPYHSALPLGQLFCFGLGYSGARLALALRALDWQVAGTSRDDAALHELKIHGIAGQQLEHAEIPPGTRHILSTIPPGTAGDPVLLAGADKITAAKELTWLGYLSTTGVYGDRGGAWVAENDAPKPGNERSRQRLAAEQAWLDLWRTRGVPVHIFRLAGIYGPGRNALAAVRAGTSKRIVKPGHLFSRIHVDDIVQVLLASMAAPNPGAIYNVCDDEAAPPADVVSHACELLSVTPPPAQDYDANNMSAMARSFWAENRRVRNDRIKNELGIDLRYPDYRSGLKALLADEVK
ncbi:MAG: SDR family oxidoreductase [Rhodospirillaceae bacterium]|nr:SDR family oxidoreductase [Rhodospirillaceae bacterium]